MSCLYNPSRLKNARLMAKLSLDELAGKLGELGLPLTKQALSKYENGDLNPSSYIIDGVARILMKPVTYFTKGEVLDLGDVDYRIVKSRFSSKDRASILALAGDYFERYMQLEELTGLRMAHQSRLPHRIAVSNELDAENAALKMRRHWNLGDRPIASIVKLFENDGIKLYRIPSHEGFDAFVASPEGDLVMCFATIQQPDDSGPGGRRLDLPRMRFNLVHELAHAILDFSPEILADERQLERLCHVFSGNFLMPSTALKRALGEERRSRMNIRELIDVKQEYGISLKALGMRMLQCELLTQAAYRSFSIFYNMKKYGRTVNEPGRFIGDERPKRFDSMIGDALLNQQINYNVASVLTESDVEIVKEKYALLG
ncbi:XRE family transcriptional regulator [Coraliomargarita algicola]|uniref:XRE family transcriptional regulator n=3 Tax=Coraliomargaritaceae TaxID=3056371 RepID=A0ABU1AXK6_9BACT|nr:XRE family transcriptional regulator [Coraliomargarita sp. J2-16]MDQ8208821.1 XRE family transcriptional regulator [Coraliomargarita sp. SDUM461003]WPJ94792.1 XRE family transcriptional regulator [Coraliomargarita sp. J2-16]